jgi:hypothetical protein
MRHRFVAAPIKMAPVCQLEMTFPGFEEPWGARVEMHENRLEATRYLSMDHSKEHKKRGLAGLGRLTVAGRGRRGAAWGLRAVR